MKTKLIGSAGSLEALTKLTSEYFCGSTIVLNLNGSVSNSKGPIQGLRWIKKGARFRLERIEG